MSENTIETTPTSQPEATSNNKYRNLLLGLILDTAGMVTSSYIVPMIGDGADLFWAPIAGYAMTKMYKGKEGKIAGLITLAEEAIPMTDIVPTFTLMWIYTYLIQGKKVEKIIDATTSKKV